MRYGKERISCIQVEQSEGLAGEGVEAGKSTINNGVKPVSGSQGRR